MLARAGHWYLDEHSTYIWVFGAIGAPHLLPAHVPDQIVVVVICYQTILQGYNAILVKDKKRAFIPYGFHVGFYLVKDTTQAKQEGLIQLEFRFPTGRFLKHNPKGMVLQHASQVSSYCKYAHDKFEDEIFTECTQDWDKVVQRMVNPNMTRFKAMSMDEHVEIIEQSSQEVLRSKEEIKAAETTKA
jgi:hypothetical protein